MQFENIHPKILLGIPQTALAWIFLRNSLNLHAFISDCLETLEEIGMEAKEDFEEKGGDEMHVVPCINDRDDWVNVLSRWIDEWATAS